MTANELKRAIEAIRQPIVELAGPTPEGYELISKYGITLPTRLRTTNRTKRVTLNPFGDNPQTYAVDEVADVKSLPYAAASIGMLMVTALPVSDHDAHDGPYTSVMKQQVEDEYSAVCAGNLSGVHHALHLCLYAEAARVLVPGGLLLQVWPHERGAEAARQFGLVPVFEEHTPDYTVVFRNG